MIADICCPTEGAVANRLCAARKPADVVNRERLSKFQSRYKYKAARSDPPALAVAPQRHPFVDEIIVWLSSSSRFEEKTWPGWPEVCRNKLIEFKPMLVNESSCSSKPPVIPLAEFLWRVV